MLFSKKKQHDESAYRGSSRRRSSQSVIPFDEWYSNGHINESDPNTCILRIRLTDGVLFDHGTKHEFTIDR